MNELIKLLDKNLEYVSHSIINDTMFINIKSCRSEVICPYCMHSSIRVHSIYTRTLQDLPIQDKKVVLVLSNKKMFCDNNNCSRVTFAETFSFYNFKAKKTKRLESYIFKNSLNVSTVVSAKLLKINVANISKSTVGNILKKRRTN